MKKFLALILVLTLCVSITACGSSPSKEPSETDNQAEESDSQQGSVEVDKNLLTVDITLPASMFEDQDMSTFDPDAYASEQGFKKAVLNEDNSITVTMTKAKHEALMQETMESIDQGYSEMIEAEDTPYIKEIIHSDDFSTIDVKVDKAGYETGGLQAAFVPLSVYLMGCIYQVFNGDEGKSEICIIDVETGETIDSVIYPDALNSQQ